jgi:hypothetical protein
MADGCWEYDGSKKNERGYPQVSWGRLAESGGARNYAAAAVAVSLWRDIQIDSIIKTQIKCRNTLCCNPDHIDATIDEPAVNVESA